MLEPQTRAALTEQLKPPSGFELSYAVGTSFTLDLASALTVPLSFASHRLASDDDQLGVLDAIRRASDRIDIFAQAGELSMGAESDLVAFLEPMIHPVLPRRGLFHPKVWFLQYRADEQLTHRFLCASRNLTADRSWDVLVRLDELPAHRRPHHDPETLNEPLVFLLRSLPEICVQPMPAERREKVRALAEQWRSLSWELPDGIRSLAFHALGGPARALPDLGGIRSLLISPFVSDDGLALLRAGVRGETHLLSRAESMDALAPESLDARLTTYVLDDAASLTDDPDQPGATTAAGLLSGLHAKVVVTDRRDGAHVFLGSANATGAAWHRNVEVMVELVGSVPSFGVEATLRSLGDLKGEYEPAGGQAPDEDEKAAQRLEAAVRGLAGTRVTARVIVDDPYALRVWADDDFASRVQKAADVGITLRWHLLTRADLGDSRLAAGEEAASVLHGIELTDITPFVVLIARDDRGNERRTILVAQLLDDVATRRDAIIARKLTDRAAFVRLLTLLLELSGVGMPIAAGSGAQGFFPGVTAGEGVGAGLFEALVRAVGAGHQGLADARRIIDFVRDHGDENAVLPEGFDELWARVWEAHLSLNGTST